MSKLRTVDIENKITEAVDSISEDGWPWRDLEGQSRVIVPGLGTSRLVEVKKAQATDRYYNFSEIWDYAIIFTVSDDDQLFMATGRFDSWDSFWPSISKCERYERIVIDYRKVEG